MKAMKAFITVVALGLVAFVVVGLILPGSWSTERGRILAAPPGEVFPYLEDVALWREWSAMGQVEGTLSDPSRGEGAWLTWDDPQWGQGEFRITGTVPGAEVEYEVAVEEGSMVTRGHIRIAPGQGSTTVLEWREEGDLGWNPLLAYFALGMERMQGDELDKSLDRLQELLEGRDPAGPVRP